MKPDSDAEPAPVRVRRFTRVSAMGKVVGPRPSAITHTQVSVIGANSRPRKPTTKQPRNTITSGNGFTIRVQRLGTISVATKPTPENSATMLPPRAALPPESDRIVGIQVNIAYVLSEVMPNIAAAPQASGERQIRPVGSDGASPVTSSTS